METLFAIAIAVGVLKAHAAPPPELPKTVVATERRQAKGKPAKPPGKPEPSLGF